MKKLLVVFIVVLLAATWLFYLYRKYPLTSPFKSSTYFFEHLLHPHKKIGKTVLGFLPYWRLADIKYAQMDTLTEVNYFGLYVNGDGAFITIYNGEKNPGMREWEGQTVKDFITKNHINGNKFTLSVICQDDDDIESLLESGKAQKKLIDSIIAQMQIRGLDGVNIDFEYTGSPDEKYQKKFTEFSKTLRLALKKQNPQSLFELSVMPLSARPQELTTNRKTQTKKATDLFNFPDLVSLYDRFIGMSYDFHTSSSRVAGPIAPMTGFSENKYFFDVTTMYDDLSREIPKDKIVMGIPYYGWDWAVENGKTIQSTTLLQTDDKTAPSVMSYARAREDKDLKKSQCVFDDYALEPWCWYTDPKTKIDHQVWFENTKSIGIKYDFAKKQNFNAIAIWVLGYDKNYPDLWEIINSKFSTDTK